MLSIPIVEIVSLAGERGRIIIRRIRRIVVLITMARVWLVAVLRRG
jgi:hypothetical protein